MPRMSSPAEGRVSSAYGTRAGGFHAGIDIATGGKSAPVHASFAGTIEKIVRGRKHGDRSASNQLAPGRTGNGLIIRNPDGERQLYGHVEVPASLRVGSKVDVGDKLGVTDLSGNTTGHHVHYEEWTRSGATRDPMDSFRAFQVTPGARPAKAIGEAKPPPAAKSTTDRYPYVSVGTKVDELKSAWFQLLGALDYTGTTTERLQKFLRASGHYTGPVDDQWGPGTTIALQARLRGAGLNPGPVDGVRGSQTRAAEAAYLNAHAWRAR